MTAEQIKEQIELLGYTPEYFENMETFPTDLTDIVGPIEMVEENGGYEGGGESYNYVLHFKDHNIFLNVDYSYKGTCDFEQVYPYEKMTTYYSTTPV